MDIKKIFKEYELEHRKFMVSGREYPVTIATYLKNRKNIAKYYILDFVNNSEYSNCESEWRDIKKFEEFERILLENEFFSSQGDSRFNLYLVVVVKESSDFLYDSAIRNDFKYARKVILTEKQVQDYFGFISFKRENTPYFSSKVQQKEIIQKMQILGKKVKEVLDNEILIYYFINNIQLQKVGYTEYSKCLSLYGRFVERLPYDNDTVCVASEKLSYDKYRIKSINKITIENFRFLKEPKTIPFGRVNLLYGENGVGKTTLLDAIELGITGMNRKNDIAGHDNARIMLDCTNDKGCPILMCSDNDYTSLAEDWYGINAPDKEMFNKMFNQYNYFDTGFASAFAIEGQIQVNLFQLQDFLGIDKIENGAKLLNELYMLVEEFSLQNMKVLNKKRDFGAKYILELLLRKKIDSKRIAEISEEDVVICREGQKELEEIDIISLEDILNAHIKKIEGIFKMLIASNEYAMLKVEDGEIVAIRSSSGESVSMAKMSTGQKVCLALAFMFDLFLSSSKTPNIIMLDEPVANLDDLHMLNLLDILRKLALSGTQVFFTTANPTVAQLFRRKFSFIEDDFRFFNIIESDQRHEISYSLYSPTEEAPKKVVSILKDSGKNGC